MDAVGFAMTAIGAIGTMVAAASVWWFWPHPRTPLNAISNSGWAKTDKMQSSIKRRTSASSPSRRASLKASHVSDFQSNGRRVPRAWESDKLKKNAQEVERWLRVIHNLDLSMKELQEGIEPYYCKPRDVHAPLCDTETQQLLLDFGIPHIHISRQHDDSHPNFLKLEARHDTSSASLNTPLHLSSPYSSLPSAVPPAALPSHVLHLGRLLVSPLIDGNYSKNYERLEFEVVVDVTDPSLPLCIVWPYRVFDGTDMEYHDNPLYREDPIFGFLPVSPGGIYDAVRLGYLADVRLPRSGGPLFTLKTALENAEATRAVYRPRLCDAHKQIASDVITKS